MNRSIEVELTNHRVLEETEAVAHAWRELGERVTFVLGGGADDGSIEFWRRELAEARRRAWIELDAALKMIEDGDSSSANP